MLLPTKPEQKHLTMLCFSNFVRRRAPIVLFYFFFVLPRSNAQCPPTNLVPNFSFETISIDCSFPTSGLSNGIINGAFNEGCVDGWSAAHGTPSVCNNNPFDGAIFACLGANNEAIFLPLPFANLMTQSCDVQNALTFSSRCISASQSGTIQVYFTNGLLNTPTTNTGASPMNIPPGSQLIGNVNVSGLNWESSTLLLPAMSPTNNQLLLVWVTNDTVQSDVGLDEIEIHSYSSPLKPDIKCISFNGTNFSLEGYLLNSIQGFNVANWTWRFGNGTTVQGQNATVANIVYPVTLCITDNCGLTSFVTVNQAGQATDIFTNTILSADQEFLGDLIVHSGAQLTVTGTLGFQQGYGLIVERNARLVLTDGGVLTRGCNTPHWDGVNVLGNSSLTQPATNAPLLNPNQSGIVFMDDGQIEWALTGISTGGGYSSAFWGGVVDASNSRFVNNRKAVEFMQYTQSTNISQFVNVEFWEMADQWGSAFNNTEGVSIWETNGIEFKHCTFRNFDRHGIRTFDSQISVLKGCRFEGNTSGIAKFSTFPMTGQTIIGAENSLANIFIDNQVHINASLNSAIAKSLGTLALSVVNNNFYNGQFGVVVDGASDYIVAGNLFDNVQYGVQTQNTELDPSLVGCNTFTNGQTKGIENVGNNSNLVLLGNDFNMASGAKDIVVSEGLSGWPPGEIYSSQGIPFGPAANCFSNPSSQIDIETVGATVEFNYWYLPNELTTCFEDPLNPGNYVKMDAQVKVLTDNCMDFGGLPPGLEEPDTSHLEFFRNALIKIEQRAAYDSTLWGAYFDTLRIKTTILNYLIADAVENQDFETARTLLDGEASESSGKKLFSIHLFEKNYTAASTWLNQFFATEPEDIAFIAIQQINLSRLQNPDSFQLSQAQEIFLNDIADAYSPIRGYARALLALLKGNDYYPDVFEEEFNRSEERTVSFHSPSVLKVFPNPASDKLIVDFPTEELNVQVRILSLYGQVMYESDLPPNNSGYAIQVNNWPNGLYIIELRNPAGKIDNRVFAVQR